jgi:cytochrome c biogenesis protein CcdA
MGTAPYAVALAAGMLAAFNPCGFALLPAYLGLLLGDGKAGVGRALAMSLAMTAGFVAVFGAFGAVVAPLAVAVEQHLPWVTVVIGVVLLGGGLWLAAGREIDLRLPGSRAGGAPGTSTLSMLGYGVAYAVASLSCTIGPFLAITSATFTQSGWLAGLSIFVTYGAGMGLVITVLAVAVVLARGAAVARLRAVLPYVGRLSGVLLLIAGAYVTYYGIYELRLFTGRGGPEDPVVDVAVGVQATIVRWIQAVPAWGWLVVLASLVALAVVLRRPLRKAPVDGRRALPDEQLVHPAVRPRAEEPPRG